MASKLKQAIQILKHIENPSSLIIIDIAKELNCSERWVWEAKKRLLDERKENTKEFNLLKELTSDLIYLSSFLKDETVIKNTLKVRDKRRLNKISEHLELFKDDMELQDYIQLKESLEVDIE